MTNTDEFVELGDRVKDAVSSLEGIATAATKYLNGCRRIMISPHAEGGKFEDERWFDEVQLIVTERSAYKHPIQKQELAYTGGDRLDCPSR